METTAAIQRAVELNKPLLITISSGSEEEWPSKLMGDPEVRSAVDNSAVLLQIRSETPDYYQLAQVVQAAVPSILVIYESKVALNLGEAVSRDEFLQRWHAAVGRGSHAEPERRPSASSRPHCTPLMPMRGPVAPRNRSVESGGTSSFDKQERDRIMRLVEADRRETGSRLVRSSAADDQPKPIKRTGKNQCSLAVRLIDGSTLRHTFNSSDSLDTVREMVRSSDPSVGAFKFCAAWPKRELEDGDEKKTLQELGLTPSATLIINEIAQRPALSWAAWLRSWFC